MRNKKSIIFAYNAMNIGGSTTSLLSILSLIDYNKYDVDLLLNFNVGELLDLIPKEVNLLPPSMCYVDRKKEYLHRFLSPRFMWHYFISKIIAYKSKVPIQAAQYREWKDIEFQRKIDKEYDVAIAFLEGDRCKFVARHIKAKKKLAWIHINYSDAKFDPKYDRDTMCVFDKIVLVSKDCKTSFDNAFPELSKKSCVIENILSSRFVRDRANETIDFKFDDKKINLVTCCRVSFRSKGLDRAVRVISQLKKDGLLNDLVWYIIGDGGDMPALCQMIINDELQGNIILLGSKINPYPYFKDMSMFFLPSLWEGKPMAVTEGFMMGLPALVTEYSSAREQVRHNVDGYIMENSEDGIYEGLKYVINHRDNISDWRNNVINTDYSNIEEFKKIENLLD